MFSAPFPLPGGGQDFMGYVHPGSAMFNRQSQGNFLARTYVSDAADRTEGTVACWARPGEIAALSIDRTIFSGGADGNNRSQIRINTSGALEFIHLDGAATTDQLITTRVLKDPTAWYFILFWYDTDQPADVDKMGFEVNGVEAPLATANYPALGKQLDFGNSAGATKVGQKAGVNDQVFEGFLADFHWIEGTALRSNSFGRFNPIHGEFIPKKVTGLTYGGHGVHLDFADPADLGNDVSGNANDFTAQGTFGAANAFADVPANTFPIGNSVLPATTPNWSEACLTVTETSATASSSYCTHVLPPGKWYWSQKPGSGAGAVGFFTDVEEEISLSGTNILGGSTRRGFAYNGSGQVLVDGALQTTQSGWVANDVVTIWLDNTDPTSVKVWVDINDIQQGPGSPNPATGTDPLVTYTNAYPFPQVVQCIPGWGHDTSQLQKMDFGQRRGAESFLPAPLGDFKPISTGNFPVPLGPALLPENYFAIREWDGDSVNPRAVVDDLKFRPGWIELRSENAVANWRAAFDVAGYSPTTLAPNNLVPNATVGAGAEDDGNITSINDDGFTVDAGTLNENEVNLTGRTYQAWCWKNDPEAGIEIQKVVGTGAIQTLTHSLGRTPEFMMYKRLDGIGSWVVYHSGYSRVSDPETDRVLRENSAAAADSATAWGDTAPTDTQYTLGSDVGLNEDHVVILIASIPGFSKVSSYEGNGSANGPLQPLLFSPKYRYGKNWNAVGGQHVMDNVLDGQDNQQDAQVDYASTAARANQLDRDQLAGGWKVRNTTSDNTAGQHTQGVIFAEVGQKFARAR